jgi:hypothetical protein
MLNRHPPYALPMNATITGSTPAMDVRLGSGHQVRTGRSLSNMHTDQHAPGHFV